jgi:hypothetical protein
VNAAARKPKAPQRAEAARAAPPREPVAEAPRRLGSAPAVLTVVQRAVAIALMAALGVSLAAYFIPRPRVPGEKTPAVDRMQAPRLWQMVRFWGLSRDEKRRRAPDEWMGGEVFAFTQSWGKYLDKRLMPMTKIPDWTRDEHIAYLLPGTGRPAPPGADKRPPVIVGYRLKPSDLKPSWFTQPTVAWTENEPVGRIVLDEGRRVGQSFITHLDFDCINRVLVLAPPGQDLPDRGYTGIIYSALNRRHVLARTTGLPTDPNEGGQQLIFTFDPPLRLKHHRGSTPYLFEMSWQRPAGYAGPAPAFALYGGTALVVSDLYIDGERQPDRDLGFMAQGTHTDVDGYTVRDDVLERVGPPKRGESTKQFFDRLNKVLLEL